MIYEHKYKIGWLFAIETYALQQCREQILRCKYLKAIIVILLAGAL